MSSLMDSPAFGAYAVASVIVGLQLIALAGWTGTVRTMRKTFVNPEDAALNKGTAVDVEHPDVQRVKRAHQNAIENAIPFFAIGLLYVLTGGSKLGGQVYFGTFAAVRVLHSIFYLWGKQPFRTMMFGIGVLATIGMAVHVLRVVI